MGHSGGKWVTLRKVGHTLKNGPQLELWLILKNRILLGKMGLTCKNGSHFQKEKSSQFQREKPWEQG